MWHVNSLEKMRLRAGPNGNQPGDESLAFQPGDHTEVGAVAQRAFGYDVAHAATQSLAALLPPVSQLSLSSMGDRLSGTGQAGAMVHVLDASRHLIGKALVGSNGDFISALTVAQTSGSTLEVYQADPLSGQASPPVTVLAPVTDLAEPADTAGRAGQTAAEEGDAAGLHDLRVTYALEVGTPHEYVSGYAKPGATITVTNAAGEVVAWGLADANGYFIAYIPANNYIRGEDLTVSYGADGQSYTQTVEAPDFEHPKTPWDVTLSDDMTEVTGQGVSGMTIEVRNEQGVLVGSAAVDAMGQFTLRLDEPLTPGEKISVAEHSPLDKTSPAYEIVVPEPVHPDAPADLSVDLSGTHVSGKGEAGNTVKVYHDGVVIGSATVGADGSFSVTISPAQVAHELLSVTQSSLQHVESEAATVYAPDLTEPAPPQVDPLSSAGDHVTGTAISGNVVTVYDKTGQSLGSAVAAENGHFDINLSAHPQTQGQKLSVTQTSAYAVESRPATVYAQDLPPSAPTDLHIDDHTGHLLTGKGIAGDTIKVYDKANQLVGKGTVAADNSFVIELDKHFTHGETLSVRQYSLTQKESAAAYVGAPFVDIDFGTVINGDVAGHDYTKTTYLVDTTGNGKLDLVHIQTADSSDLNKPGKISVYLGDGHGNFATTPSFVTSDMPSPVTGFDGWRSTFFADVTGDGNVDMVFALYNIAYSDNYLGSTIYVFKGHGDGTFDKTATKTTAAGNLWGGGDGTSNGYHQTFLVDLDGHGKMGLASITDAGTMKVYLSNGDGTFSKTAISTPMTSSVPGLAGTYAGSDQYRSSFMADVNHDGKADYVFTFYNVFDYKSYILVYQGDGRGNFAKTPSVTTHNGNVWGGDSATTNTFLADVDGDGYPDLVVVDAATAANGYTQHGIHVYKNLGNGTFSSASVDTTNLRGGAYTGWDGTHSVFMTDVTGDGRPDLVTVVYDGSRSRISVYANLGNNHFSTAANEHTVNSMVTGEAELMSALSHPELDDPSATAHDGSQTDHGITSKAALGASIVELTALTAPASADTASHEENPLPATPFHPEQSLGADVSANGADAAGVPKLNSAASDPLHDGTGHPPQQIAEDSPASPETSQAPDPDCAQSTGPKIAEGDHALDFTSVNGAEPNPLMADADHRADGADVTPQGSLIDPVSTGDVDLGAFVNASITEEPARTGAAAEAPASGDSHVFDLPAFVMPTLGLEEPHSLLG